MYLSAPPVRVPPYDALAAVYDDIESPDAVARLLRVLDRVVDGYGLDLSAVADVGCGTGRLLHWLRERGAGEVYGTDASAAMLRIARARNRSGRAPVVLLRQRFANLDLPRRVSLICCTTDALNYERTPRALLTALRAIRLNLRPGGAAILDLVVRAPEVTTRAEWWYGRPGFGILRLVRRMPRSPLRRAEVWLRYDDGRVRHEVHVQRPYSIPLTYALLRRAGFRVLGVHDFDTLRPPSARTRRAVFVVRLPLVGQVVSTAARCSSVRLVRYGRPAGG